LAVVIPPSIPMILYGVMSNSSVVELFVAGIIPGVLGGTGMMAMSYWMARRHGWPVEDVFELGKLWRTFKEAVWALILPVIILGGIFGGLVTATEGGGLAVVAALFIGGLIYRELDWHFLKDAIIEGGIQTAVAAILDLTDNRYAVLALLNIFFLVIGLFLHSAAAIILVVPIVMPLVNSIGIDPVHFGLVVTLNLGIGQQTPPVASVLITACTIAKANIWEVSKVNIYFISVLFAVLMMVTYLPMIPMSLVEYFYR
jgi:TRAP-type C4-dicarboxylate transport system permease large subunit